MALTIVSASNPVHGDALGRSVNLMVRFAEIDGAIPFFATPDDPEPHGRKLCADALAGKYGPVAPYPKSAEQQLSELKDATTLRVDRKAEDIRQGYLTSGQGQVMVYQRKGEEAKQLQNDPNPDPANYPILSATVGIEGATIQEVAALVLATEAAWVQIAAAIETARLGGKAAIMAATSEH